jgi:sporulation-control protein
MTQKEISPVVFKKMLAALGVGGPSVDTVLGTHTVTPGGVLTGSVNITGGDHETAIEYVSVGLVTRVEVESGDQEYSSNVEFHTVRLTGPFTLAAGANHSLPFSVEVPWETPITTVYGQQLHGMTMGLRTELSVAKAVDKTDLDPVSIAPLPVHEAILGAFSQLGFRFSRADLEKGHIGGTQQRLPFYQEIEFYASGPYSSKFAHLEVTFITSPQSTDVVLEFDKRGFLGSTSESYSTYRVNNAEAATVNWQAVVDGWVSQAINKRGYH